MRRIAVRTWLALTLGFGLVVSASGQETTDVPPEELESEQTETPAAPPPQVIPDGILPIAEIGRIPHAPRDRSSLLLEAETLVAVTTAGLVEAYDSTTGAFRWRLGLPGLELLPPVAYRTEPFEILLSSPSGKWLLVEGKKGDILREGDFGMELALPPLPLDGVLYVGTPEGVVGALELGGREIFRAQTMERPQAFSMGGGLLVVSGAERTLTALDAKTGEVRWSRRGRAGFSPAVFRDPPDRLYVGDDAGELYCLDAKNGNVKFHWSTGAAIRAPALVVDKRVYVASYGNNLYAYGAGGGSEQWRVSLPGRPASGPILVGKRILIATLDGQIVEVDPLPGRIGKSYRAPGELASSPVFWISNEPVVEVAPAVPLPLPATTDTTTTETTPDTTTTESELPPAPTPAYEKHRIALTLRSGQVLLLGHQKPEPVAPDAEKPVPEAVPTEGVR